MEALELLDEALPLSSRAVWNTESSGTSPVAVRRTRGTFRAVRCSASSAERESAARSLSICSAADPHASRPRGIPFALVPLAAWVDSCSHFRSPKRARKEKQE